MPVDSLLFEAPLNEGDKFFVQPQANHCSPSRTKTEPNPNLPIIRWSSRLLRKPIFDVDFWLSNTRIAEEQIRRDRCQQYDEVPVWDDA